MLLRNANMDNEGQSGVIVQATYKAPQVVDTFVPKESCSCLPPFTSLNEVTLNNFLNIYPNPSMGVFELEWDQKQMNESHLDLTVFDIHGNVQYQEKVLNDASLRLDMSYLSSGIYTIVLAGERVWEVEKVVIINGKL